MRVGGRAEVPRGAAGQSTGSVDPDCYGVFQKRGWVPENRKKNIF